MTNSSDRLDRIERILERLAQNQGQIVQTQEQFAQGQSQIIQSLERMIQIQGQQQDQIQILASAAARHDALIERLDAIIERMVYREGRGGNDDQPQP